MEVVGGLALTLLGAIVGAWLQARSTRRQWHAETGAAAWRDFVRGVHAWRAELDSVRDLPDGDPARYRQITKMERMMWDLQPDAPAIHVFAPPEVDRAALNVLSLASDIVARLKAGDPVERALVDEFDSAKWSLVVAATVSF